MTCTGRAPQNAMVQATVTTQWLLDGFKYDLGSTRNPQTLTYYSGHVQRFQNWAEATGVPKEAHLIGKPHIQPFFYHLLQETEIVIGGNVARRKIDAPNAAYGHITVRSGASSDGRLRKATLAAALSRVQS